MRVWVLLLLAAALGQPPWLAVHAQSTPPGADQPPDPEYARLVAAALEAYDAGRWADARGFFERAHGQQPNARTLFGLGVTAFELGRHAQAIEELQAALGDRRLPLSIGQRTEASDIIARAGQHVAFVHIEVEPKDARVLVDGNDARSRDLTLSPGEYTVAARAPRYRESRQSISVAAGQRRALRFELVPVDLTVHDVPPEATELGADPTLQDDSGVLQSWWFWTVVGVVVAGGVVAAVVVAGDDDDAGPRVNARHQVLRVAP